MTELLQSLSTQNEFVGRHNGPSKSDQQKMKDSATAKAKEEMKSLKMSNERILMEARNERDQMLKEAREIREKLIAEAKADATKVNERMLKEARESIKNEKMAAITELKNQVGMLSLEIAEKVLKSELKSDEKQKALVSTLLKEVNLN